MYLTCFLFRFLSVSHTSTLSHHPHTLKPPSFSLSILFGPITHIGQILYFGQNWPKCLEMPETHRSRPKFNPRWNKGDYHFGLYVDTRFSVHCSWNEMDLITLVFGMGWWSPLDELVHDSFTPQVMWVRPLSLTNTYFNVWLCCTILQIAKVYDTCKISL